MLCKVYMQEVNKMVNPNKKKCRYFHVCLYSDLCTVQNHLKCEVSSDMKKQYRQIYQARTVQPKRKHKMKWCNECGRLTFHNTKGECRRCLSFQFKRQPKQ